MRSFASYAYGVRRKRRRRRCVLCSTSAVARPGQQAPRLLPSKQYPLYSDKFHRQKSARAAKRCAARFAGVLRAMQRRRASAAAVAGARKRFAYQLRQRSKVVYGNARRLAYGAAARKLAYSAQLRLPRRHAVKRRAYSVLLAKMPKACACARQRRATLVVCTAMACCCRQYGPRKRRCSLRRRLRQRGYAAFVAATVKAQLCQYGVVRAACNGSFAYWCFFKAAILSGLQSAVATCCAKGWQ
ncbi:hypothetical protein NPIL_405231 [Nephila pilipes]|uniref:Uncharacterized protein n=1 Tax=Nephila pilipes TaxID=299642 RepID=A0A8X6NXR4_NEPPI|nr:hypothetical protein NPIL_405231 [Nephila pilipes]